MRVTLLAFGILRELLGNRSGPIDLPAGSTVRDLLDRCRQTSPDGPSSLWSSIAVAVNREYASAAQPLADGDEVALLPPVSGGSKSSLHSESPAPASSAPAVPQKKYSPPQTATTSAVCAAPPQVALTDAPIDSGALAASLRRGEDGAVVVFDGIVRNHTRDRRTLYLFYEAYPEMALTQMRLLAGQALADFPIRDLAIVHRLGRLEIGETSVLIAVASAHRAAAFDACRWLIDTLKQTVPIWKKEFFEDGAVWAQGDPFPPSLTPDAAPSAKAPSPKSGASPKPASRKPAGSPKSRPQSRERAD
jgi:MoaE-MoaD fusion protein